MTLRSRLVIVCSATAVCLSATILPAAAGNISAHAYTKTLRHPVRHQQGSMMMMRRDKQ